MDAEVLQNRLDRAQEEIRGLEQLIETKTRDLFLSQESLRKAAEFQENVLKAMASALAVVDPEGNVVQVNEAATRMLGRSSEELKGVPLTSFVQLKHEAGYSLLIDHEEVDVELASGSVAQTLFSSSALHGAGGEIEGYVCVWADVSETKQLEVELRHAQKLESLGQMAAGIAHEINTPIQFVGDSLRFLQEAFDDLLVVLQECRTARAQWGSQVANAQLAEKLAEVEGDADVEFIEEEAPGAFQRASNGLARVASIVKALKGFSHPGSETFVPTNLNETIETTLTLARNEYKYVSDIDLQLGELPEIPCNSGDMGQVILNLIVNAAHAIGEKVEGTEERGTIRVASYVDGDFVAVEIGDTGAGIPDTIRQRIFDPFFTTKEVGKGTGQGLAITRRIVVDKHNGRIDLDSKVGEGTTFVIRLPLKYEAQAA